MELTLHRTKRHRRFTLGTLSIEGEPFCHTLEPISRRAIPEGRYPLVVTRSEKFGEWLPLLLHVQGFTDVRIHAGNTVEDTKGCILVGYRSDLHPEKFYDSRLWLRRLLRRLVERPLGEGVWITID